jgi:hypothetical protein
MVCRAIGQRRRITAGIFIDGCAGAAMYAGGERATHRLFPFGHKLAGLGGENAIYLAGQTIRGVALGVVVTAIAQVAFWRDEVDYRRRSPRWRSHRGNAAFVHRTDRSESCSRCGCSVALLDR